MNDKNKLRRQNGIVAGVAGGLAEFFDLNVLYFRLLFILLMLPFGVPGPLIYIILWLIIPQKQ